MLEIFKNKIDVYQDNPQGNTPHFKSNVFKDKIETIPLNEEYKNMIYYPSSKEWFSSVYTFNKSYVKSLIINDTTLNNLLRSYANSIKGTVHRFRRRRNNKIRYSGNKLYLSKAELKHTNSKLVVLVYLFNKKRLITQGLLIKEIYNLLYKIRLYYIIKSLSSIFLIKKNLLYKVRAFKFNYFKELENNTYFKTIYNKLSNISEKNTLTTNSIPYIDTLKMLFKENTVLDSSIDLNYNTFKFNISNLNLNNIGILKLLEKIYGKKVEIRVVDLKSLHLNSDIFSSAVALKLRDRHNKAVTVLRKAIIHMVKIPDLHTLITFDDNKPFMNKTNVLNTISQQVVSGVRFEASGRLTKRLTAMRAVFKYRYVGTLKNIRSSFNNKPSTILRGVLKSNGQYSLINSKTRNGTFGLKG